MTIHQALNRKIVLHVGASKCGSSALQQALSARPIFADQHGREVAYVAILTDGRILFGDELTIDGVGRPHGYAASTSGKSMTAFGPNEFHRLSRELADLSKRYRCLVLSQEGWLLEHRRFLQADLLARLGISAHVVVYVRPQVPFMNAGWWQWGAWSGKTLDEWVAHRLPVTRWSQAIAAWRGMPGVESVTVRLLPDDVVTDFFGLLAADPPPERQQANTGLSGEILRLYQRHRHLRPSSHVSGIDFILSRYVNTSSPTAWVIEPKMAEHIVAETREDNLALKAMLDPQSAAIMEADLRWWDAAVFADKRVEPAEANSPNAEESDRLAAELAEAIFQLGCNALQLQRKLFAMGDRSCLPGPRRARGLKTEARSERSFASKLFRL